VRSSLLEHIERIVAIRLVIHLAINFRDLLAPLSPLPMLHIHHIIMRPMEVVSDKPSLLVEALLRVYA